MMDKSKKKYPILAAQQETIERCFRCGLCKTVCPSFEETGEEGASPRGRNQFARAVLEGEAPLKDAVASRMLDCLNCMRCAEICPADVRTDRVVLAARAEMARRGRLNIFKKIAFKTILRSPALLHTAAAVGGFFERLVYRASEFLQTFIPMAMGMEDKYFPDAAGEQFHARWPRVNMPSNSEAPVKTVAYFVGCAANLIYPEVGDAVIRVLNHNGVAVIVPRGQACCGIPVYSSGDHVTAKKLAQRNFRVFNSVQEDIDAIVTDCASCSAALKHEIGDVLGVSDHFDVPVYDLNEFLMHHISLDTTLGEVPIHVTYHDPCHLKRGQGIWEEPRNLLRLVPGVEFTEMSEPGRCCGGAGTFAYTHHELSRLVGSRKVLSIRDTGADYVATPCPSCTMQLDDLLHHAGLDMKVIHPVEILDRGYRAAGVYDEDSAGVEGTKTADCSRTADDSAIAVNAAMKR